MEDDFLDDIEEDSVEAHEDEIESEEAFGEAEEDDEDIASVFIYDENSSALSLIVADSYDEFSTPALCAPVPAA